MPARLLPLVGERPAGAERGVDLATEVLSFFAAGLFGWIMRLGVGLIELSEATGVVVVMEGFLVVKR